MRVVQRFFSFWQNWLAVACLLIFVTAAAAAPLLAPLDPDNPGVFKTVGRTTDFRPHPPSKEALLGTMPGQVDVYHTLIWGTRSALFFGLAVAGGAFLFGVLLGAVSGYAGGVLNSLIMRVSDAFLTFPLIAGVVIIQQLVAVTIEAMGGVFYFDSRFGKTVYFQFDPPVWVDFLLKVDPLLVCLIVFSWVPYTRLVNTIVMTLKRAEFIQAAQALGGDSAWIIWRHLIPNSIGPALVLAARDVGNAVILQATFTFIGLGSTSAWGQLLSMGRNWIVGSAENVFRFWWVFMPATLVVMLFGITWNMIGDGLSDAVHPSARLRRFAKAEDEARQEAAAQVAVQLSRPVQPVPLARVLPAPDQHGTPLSTRNTLIVQSARAAVLQGNLSRGLAAYEFLVQRSRCLDLVVQDLAALARIYPGEQQLWKILGDALASSGRRDFADKAHAQAAALGSTHPSHARAGS